MLTVMLGAICEPPVSSMYMVTVALEPACIVPQFSDVIGRVQALFEYTPTFGPVWIVPEEG